MSYDEHVIAWENFDKDFPNKTYPIDDVRVIKLYDDLCCRLAPENLTQDGELSEKEVAIEEKDLLRKLKRLQQKVNHKLGPYYEQW